MYSTYLFCWIVSAKLKQATKKLCIKPFFFFLWFQECLIFKSLLFCRFSIGYQTHSPLLSITSTYADKNRLYVSSSLWLSRKTQHFLNSTSHACQKTWIPSKSTQWWYVFTFIAVASPHSHTPIQYLFYNCRLMLYPTTWWSDDRQLLTDSLELALTLATNSFSLLAASRCDFWKLFRAAEKSFSRRSLCIFLWR